MRTPLVSPHDDAPDDLIDRYLADECTADERKRVEQWIMADPQQRAVLQLLGGVRTKAAVSRKDTAAVNDAIREFARRRHIDTSSSSPNSIHLPRQWKVAFWSIAAAIVLGVGFSVNTLLRRAPSSEATQFTAMREYIAQRGRQAHFTLPDGSTVLLNVDSRLRIPNHFGATTRDVYLDGEAQFTVIHHTHAPFTVHAGGAVARDLGTVFTVRSYLNEGQTQIAVTEGKVSVDAAGTTTPGLEVLTPGDLASVSFNGTIGVERNGDLRQFTEWTAGRLVFRGAMVSDVLTHLGRWYNLDFKIADPTLAQQRVDLTVPDQIWRPGVLTTIAQVLNARVERVGNVVMITSVE